ncbi:uncharacterized protein LOC110756546 [Prunus avium]|uniref:Uncharacterized protein LOC110756546 n=1 Tax=Prunus avium TaxID=42229 RepID=A0A6P5SIR7_PRUAV|nr:uncharacterized protein LOC110756546 [Prunus avium]
MKGPIKSFCFLAFLLTTIAAFGGSAYGVGECGKITTERAGWKLDPCIAASKNKNVKVSIKCCAQLRNMIRNPRCLCAIALSQNAQQSGATPEIALTIAQRCNIPNRVKGYKCGDQ